MSSQQKALFLTEANGKFAVGTKEIPKPGPGEVLVEIQATGLNPIEWKIQSFGLFVDKYPALLGTDAASIVKEVGEGVTSVAVGDRV